MWRERVVSPLCDTGILSIGSQTLKERLKIIVCSDLLEGSEFPELRKVEERVEYVLQSSQSLVILLRNSELIDQGHRRVEGQLPVIDGVRRLQFVVRVSIRVESERVGQLILAQISIEIEHLIQTI